MSAIELRAAWLVGVLCWTVALGCGDVDDAPPADTCRAVIWARAERAGERVAVIGSWDDWAAPRAMRDFPDAWQVLELELHAGDYGYLLVEESAGRLDRYNPLTTFRPADEQEVSLLRVDACNVPRVRVSAAQQVAAGAYEVELTVTPARTGAAIDPDRVDARDATGPLSVVEVDAAEGVLRVRGEGRPPGKHHATISVSDVEGASARERVATAWIDPVAPTWADGIVYQIMVDRFRGDGGAALQPPSDPGRRAGGTLDGVRAELEAGSFAALGVSALWLSPVYVNPVEAREGREGEHLYEGYHGYWPLDSRGVEPRIGGPEALHALVDAAHAHGIRVLLDLVPNHLYEANPRVAEHRADGWFHEHDPSCVCGSPTCPWDRFITTCWFTDYLPDLRFQHPDVMQSAVDDAVWWQDTFDVDGVRIDAVPMMPRAATRRIVHALRLAHGTPAAAFTLGEIFTGGGEAGTADLRYHLGPDGLDSAFDFPLMWALREAVANGGAGFAAVEEVLAHTESQLQGSGAVMARMIGNHDVTRFVTEIAGEGAADPWDAPPPQPDATDVYTRQALALGLVLALPGLPVIYYGDETGLAGAADPDNRRVMPALHELSDARAQLLEHTRRLAGVRRCLPALRTGTRHALVAGDDAWAFVRDAGDGRPAVVLASRSAGETTITLPSSTSLPPGEYVDVVRGDPFVLGEGASVAMPGVSLRVLVPAGDPCL